MQILTQEQLDKLNVAAQVINYDLDIGTIPIEDKDRKRDWFLTINEGAECRKNGTVTYNNLTDYVLAKFNNVIYFVYDEEVGDTGNNHIHLYISLLHGVSFLKMKKLFPGARIEEKKGSSFYAMNYIIKPKGLELKGKEKSHTQIKPAIEHGNFEDIVEKGKYNKDGTIIKPQKEDINVKLKALVEQFDTLEEIAEYNPNIYNLYHKTLTILLDIKRKNKLLQNGITEKHTSENGEEFYVVNRNVSYIYGLNGAGKTYSVYKRYGFNNVGLVTFNKDNVANFDNYNNQDVLLVDDFSGNIPFSTMQHMTDSYIKPLDARYKDKKSYYSNCIFTSNIPFSDLYNGIKLNNLDRYNSMLRRFTGGIWEVYQSFDGKRYISLHSEFIPSDSRFENKYKNMSSPLSEDFIVVPLEELEYIKKISNLGDKLTKELEDNNFSSLIKVKQYNNILKSSEKKIFALDNGETYECPF